ncbi:hypothetical protein V6N11_063497 [Hibiscus sabdariffa]|uniref:Glycine-rich protein n=1 Tax=Hibiscus sabdariffa TaxID=183260 RepID=A0ABR1ZSS5_9ROSI
MVALISSHVRKAKYEGARGGGHGGCGYGCGRDDGYKCDFTNDENSFNNSVILEDRESGKSSKRCSYGDLRPYHGSHCGGFSNGEVVDGERPHRLYERHIGTGHGLQKGEERKVYANEFEPMQQLSNKKSNDEIFIKLI